MTEPAPAPATNGYVAGILAALGANDPRQVLTDTPAALRRAIAGVSVEQLSRPEAAGKWSIRQVVQHLADSELVGGFRYRMVLAHDRPSLPAYDQDRWAERLRYQEADLEAALDDFATLRRANLRLLRGADPGALSRVMAHSERGDESLGLMIRLYAGHDLVHLRQIARIRRAVAGSS